MDLVELLKEALAGWEDETEGNGWLNEPHDRDRTHERIKVIRALIGDTTTPYWEI